MIKIRKIKFDFNSIQFKNEPIKQHPEITEQKQDVVNCTFRLIAIFLLLERWLRR